VFFPTDATSSLPSSIYLDLIFCYYTYVCTRANFNFKEILETDRLLLRPFSMHDAANVFEYACDAETTEYLTWKPHKTFQESANIIQTIYIPTNVYCIELKTESKCIGAFEPRVYDNESSFGYILNKKYWNNGYMSEVLKQMINVFFANPKCTQVVGTHFVGNEASGAVMSKCGMKKIGIQKETVEAKGKTFTAVLYKLERHEWEDEL